MAKERFEILKSSSYYFRLIAPNNENIGYDTDYSTKDACKAAIADVRIYSQNKAYFFHEKSSANGQWYFCLRKGSSIAPIILRSEGYSTETACLNGIDCVYKYAPTADLIDNS